MLSRRGSTAIVGLALIGAVFVGWVLLDRVGPMPGDLATADWLARHGVNINVFNLVSFMGDLGSKSVALVTIVISLVVVVAAVGVRSGLFVLASGAAPIVNEIIRRLLGPTPLGAQLFGSSSYPSGHVAYATALFGSLAWLARRHGRTDAALVLLGLIVAMGPSRIVLRAHLLSDVVAGYGVGLGWLLLVASRLGPPGGLMSGATAPRLHARLHRVG